MNHRYDTVIVGADDYVIMQCKCGAKTKIHYNENFWLKSRSYFNPILERWQNTTRGMPKCNRTNSIEKKLLAEITINEAVEAIEYLIMKFSM